jgi:hypothetical protein
MRLGVAIILSVVLPLARRTADDTAGYRWRRGAGCWPACSSHHWRGLAAAADRDVESSI